MRAIWKGALAFGMVSIPVRLYSATEDRDVSFHQVHDEDAGRVRYQRMCTVCDKEVAYADLAKGFELPSGETVLLTDEDFANLPLPTTKVVAQYAGTGSRTIRATTPEVGAGRQLAVNVVCHGAGPVSVGRDGHEIPRSNIEASWPASVIAMQLSPLGDAISATVARIRA